MLELLLATAVLVLSVVIVLWGLSIAIRDVSIIDMAFSSLIAGVVAFIYWFSNASGQAATLTLGLVIIWALRMTVYLVNRNWGHGEDVRYTKLRSWVPEGWPFYWFSLRQVFLLQGAVIWVLTLPQQIAFVMAPATGVTMIGWIGVALWGIGFFFETLGDWQLPRIRANPSKKGTVLNTGLWRYTRHPHYWPVGTLVVLAAHCRAPPMGCSECHGGGNILMAGSTRDRQSNTREKNEQRKARIRGVCPPHVGLDSLVSQSLGLLVKCLVKGLVIEAFAGGLVNGVRERRWGRRHWRFA